MKVTLFDIRSNGGGHRASYTSFLSKTIGTTSTNSFLRAVISRNPVLVQTVEDSFPLFTLLALVRSLLGKRTVGFLMRPLPPIRGVSIRLKTKYWILRILRRITQVKVLTILPFEVEPRFSEIADDWIHDLQLWDIDEAQKASYSQKTVSIAMELTKRAGNRAICIGLGRQDDSKGFNWFADLYIRHNDLRQAVLLAFGGKVVANMNNLIAEFEAVGGFGINRFITDDELFEFYSKADLVWCAYAHNNDQASGIYGRAVQFGIPVVVRHGSLIHRQCEIENISHIAITGPDDWETMLSIPPKEINSVVRARTLRMKNESLNRLIQALMVTT